MMARFAVHVVLTAGYLEQDERIPLDFVLAQVSMMESENVRVTWRTFPGEDHFLFFSQPEAVLRTASEWMTQAER